MRIVDVDAHFHEPVDWIRHTGLSELRIPAGKYAR
jgi:hypothetical protein